MVANHLSRLIDPKREELPLDESFPEDNLFTLIQKEIPWYANFFNYLVARVLPLDLNYKRKKEILLRS